jgi:hypothetical protein
MGIRDLFDRLSKHLRRPSPVASKVLDRDTLKEMVQGIASTLPDEIGCDECFEELDRFAEMKLAGKNAAEALPLVQDHLDRCNNCRKEFEALMSALRALA